MTPSENLMRRLARVNPTTAFVVALVLVLAGLFLPGIVGAAVLLLVAAGLGALTFTTWPVQAPGTRVFRVLMLTFLLLVVLIKAFAH